MTLCSGPATTETKNPTLEGIFLFSTYYIELNSECQTFCLLLSMYCYCVDHCSVQYWGSHAVGAPVARARTLSHLTQTAVTRVASEAREPHPAGQFTRRRRGRQRRTIHHLNDDLQLCGRGALFRERPGRLPRLDRSAYRRSERRVQRFDCVQHVPRERPEHSARLL